ncbi:unnamed protein product [Strongylus vulgaris]|uniref:Uncharacterized protein n=1 Tax=Strongylus vulgaris TaxID=40348 RepID=A0A3P7JNR1_STRVU|nr:unnamed protein product [Strongylus vulgaris]
MLNTTFDEGVALKTVALPLSRDKRLQKLVFMRPLRLIESLMGSSAGAKQAIPAASAGPKGGTNAESPAAEAPTVDSRLPYPNFRELFTLKNYWKTIRRNDKDCGKMMLAK